MTAQESDGETPGRRLLVVATGAANVVNLPSYLIALSAAHGHHVQVLMTRSAASILPPATVGQFCAQVYCDGTDDFSPGHVKLATWAEQVIALPATAHLLGQAAHGLAAGLVGATLLAHERPVTFFPSMNGRMWEKASVQRNVAQLRADGHNVVEPVRCVGWEIATASMRANPGLPAPAVVVRLVQEFDSLDNGLQVGGQRQE